MKKIVTLFLLVNCITCYSQNLIKNSLKGMYFANVQIENYETNRAINVTYYLYFGKNYATLNFSNNEFAACEGKYFYKEKNSILYLIRDENDGRPCPAMKDKNDEVNFPNGSEIISIKKIKNKYYIRSKRFYDKDWQLLQQK
ncbi:hypothetical protein [Flavobacterium hydatis]|uniref:Uncharacterized protein n=1 Tax=Flavobacterium hydatis TaxID=991 RepID=A0A085ZBH1_FLAHY|nr:hypothetical protein [Flavobacterium hydatis]KFF01785.1 hypothetical protein IW20_25665 [Flavobacterium hydatis]OXA84798.1 hypothetical protein B0A62_25040 [Flavobacterium hydatis]